MCLSHLIYTVRPCLIHTYHAMSMPCSDHTVLFKATARPSRRLCCGIEKNGVVGAWYGHDMVSVNQTRPHCVNQMGKTHSKPLAARHGMAGERHGHGMLMYESAFRVTCCYRLFLPSLYSVTLLIKASVKRNHFSTNISGVKGRHFGNMCSPG